MRDVKELIGDKLRFFAISAVKLDDPIQSKWQADFLQIFPSDYDKLPASHESDKECFDKNYKGKENITFEEFRKKYYERRSK